MITTENTESTEKNSVVSVPSVVNNNMVNDKLEGLATAGRSGSILGEFHNRSTPSGNYSGTALGQLHQLRAELRLSI
jgi:hypothetical protein